MFGNSYYNPQIAMDRINNQIAELEKMKNQIPQPPTPTNFTQNFQIAPNNNSVMRFANSLEEVQKDFVVGDTPYFSKDMSVVWIKNVKGEIKSYELKEIVEKDEKDLQIEFLMAQVEELKGMMESEQPITNVIKKQNGTSTTTDDETNGKTIEESKSSNVSRVSRSKKE